MTTHPLFPLHSQVPIALPEMAQALMLYHSSPVQVDMSPVDLGTVRAVKDSRGLFPVSFG